MLGNCHDLSKKTRGFTLIEVSVVMIIAGLLMVAGMSLFSIYSKGQKRDGTYENMDKFNNALGAFYSAQKRYPCPADPALPESNPLAGVENCIALTAVGSNSGGIWKVAGRDADNNSIPDNVLIGSIPYKTLRLGPEDLNPYDTTVQDDIAICNSAFLAAAPIPPQCGVTLAVKEPRGKIQDTMSAADTLDAWGNRITYAITEKLTKNTAGSFDVSYGAITVQTESGAQLSDPAGSVMWALISHGDDNNGGYNSYGNMVNACGTISVDIENCDNDSDFINGIIAMVPGATYFDDILYYSVSRLSSLWTNASDSGSIPSGSNAALDVTNRNIGNVGVGVAAPSERLEVANKIKANNFMAVQTCDSTGANCFDHGKFGVGHPTGALCPPATPPNISVMTAIVGGNVVCVDVPMAPVVAGQSCTTPGESMVGVNNLGFILCAP